jgi:hypothetical protein
MLRRCERPDMGGRAVEYEFMLVVRDPELVELAVHFGNLVCGADARHDMPLQVG